jgi:hypothetical protein
MVKRHSREQFIVLNRTVLLLCAKILCTCAIAFRSGSRAALEIGHGELAARCLARRGIVLRQRDAGNRRHRDRGKNRPAAFEKNSSRRRHGRAQITAHAGNAAAAEWRRKKSRHFKIAVVPHFGIQQGILVEEEFYPYNMAKLAAPPAAAMNACRGICQKACCMGRRAPACRRRSAPRSYRLVAAEIPNDPRRASGFRPHVGERQSSSNATTI